MSEFTIAEAAGRLGVLPETLAYAVRCGRLTARTATLEERRVLWRQGRIERVNGYPARLITERELQRYVREKRGRGRPRSSGVPRGQLLMELNAAKREIATLHRRIDDES